MDYWCDHCEIAQESEVCEVCEAELSAPEPEPVPWRWRLFIVATVIYLIWRIYQLISWLAH